ncbi:MAG: prolipoprotein diacylglyceryl transferase [Alphaproteobacteria bacterium]|nr:prolipoprotein diacylglyceryl transferase [Alphaproteobacteria bacterium]
MQPWLIVPGLGPLATYYACIALGLSLGVVTLAREGRREGLASRALFDTALIVVPASGLGARLFLVFADPARFLADPWLLLSPSGGFVFHGALIVGMLAVLGLGRLRGLDPWRVGDVYAPSVAMGQVFARLGCLGAGCCHGRPADWPLGVDVPWAVTYLQHGRLPEPLLAVPLHPSPIYESWMMIGLFAGLSWLRRRQRYPGQALVAFLGWYGVGRFVLEAFRGDAGRGMWLGGWMSSGQVTSVVLVGTALLLHRWRLATCTPS